MLSKIGMGRQMFRPKALQQITFLYMSASSQYSVPFSTNVERTLPVTSSQNACESIFDQIKDNERNEVSVGKLFSIIQQSGIQLNDPRLKESMSALMELRKKNLDSGKDQQSTFFLDKSTFVDLMHENVVILHRIIQQDFCVPKFSEFCDHIKEIYDRCAKNKGGKNADYIPQLARFNPNYWGVSLCTVDGQRCNFGDSSIPFCLQSTSKPLNYALAITELGADQVHRRVGYEPSGVSFNCITLNKIDIPHNPLINAGAILTCSLIKQRSSLSDKFEYIMKEYRKMAGYEHLGFSNTTFLSERATADRNFALAYYMQEKNCFPPDSNLVESLDFYFQLCSVEVTCESASVIAATLANGGICPTTGERVLTSEAVRDTLSLMHSCGMYDYSGQFAFKCGIPSKSGVSGAILLVIPNLMGMCLWSPPIDHHGNSVRGIQFCMELVDQFNFHNYDSLIHTQEKKYDPRKAYVEDASLGIVSLLFAAQHNDLSFLRRAYLSKEDLNVTDYDGRTALHVSAAEGHLDSVQFLLEIAKVYPEPKDRWGFTPLLEAERFNHEHVVNYLKAFKERHSEETNEKSSSDSE